ncbi:phospholipase D-like domain-containing protein [Paludisphaera soli]|uniref:phospholipase D-like domain-containing protein n=1 Tax=Paludisphaera soli TaxID=2712865 RepID=UPI0013EC552C|nr:phosphatidylserine/phosphatidylglycerophosphate/cardiolipin synthase family protein [Paludisphaera soli]
MVRETRWAAVAAVLTASALAATALGGELAEGGRPAVADPSRHHGGHPTVGRGQKALLVQDGLRATASLMLHRPVLASSMALVRLGERMAVTAARAFPPGMGPLFHQSPEAGGPCTPARITPLYDSASAYEALISLIASAQGRIDLMIFGWDDDEAGRSVADALIARARAGVLVRLIVDRGGYVIGVGNLRVTRGIPTYLDRLRAEPNVHVIETPDPFFRYDHRKVAVIDDRVVWSGGMILTRASLRDWHNFAFLAEGPIVPQYAELFASSWRSQGGCAAPSRPEAFAAGGAGAPNAEVRMVRTDLGERSLKEAVYGAVDAAKHHIYLENPYFSDPILVKKLVAARGRGVDVRAVLTVRGDVRVMNKYSAMTANRLLKAGARVYLYPGMTHVKAMSVDGALAYIGSGNFDDLSMRNNREVALTVRGPEIVREIDENLFLRDMAASESLLAPLPSPPDRLFLEATILWY